MTDVTIIIPTILKEGYWHNCIASIYKHVKLPVHIHLAVGYNNFAKACNEAAKQVNSEWLLFLNDDTIVENDFVSLMFGTAKNFKTNIVGAKLLYPDRTIQHIGVYFRDNGLPYHEDLRQQDRKIEDSIVPAVTGACMLVRKEIFTILGGFDIGFENGFEDVDFCLKAKQAGYKIALSGETNIIHYEKSTRGFNKVNSKKNLERLRRKWKIG